MDFRWPLSLSLYTTRLCQTIQPFVSAPTPPSLLSLLFSNRQVPLSLSISLSVFELSMEENRKREWKEKQVVVQSSSDSRCSSTREQVKLAALAISLNVRLRSADMPPTMLECALRYTRALLDSSVSSGNQRPNPTLIARSLKKEFDSRYGPAWHCVVGKSFGSFVTHSPGGFLYFSLDAFSLLLFKTEVHLVTQPPPPSSS